MCNLARSVQERKADLERQIAEKKAKLNRLNAMEREKERKARTKRLIELGAATESVIGPVPKDELDRWITFLKAHKGEWQR